jgi:Ser/Thr protein kinase RdoA (MazF antagonist)
LSLDSVHTRYTEVRPFGPSDLAAIPYFVVAQHFWDMGHEAGFSATRSGLWRTSDAYFDRKLAFLRRWEANQRTKQTAL